MCTILAAFGVLDAAPLVIAANRDEFYARPSGPGQLLSVRPRIVGGRDLRQGGTWMGLNEHGLFVGLTNLGPAHRGRRSRGALVLEALRARTLDEIDALLEREARPGVFSPFNLLYGEGRALRVAHVPDDAPVGVTTLGAGLHVVPSGGPPNDEAQPRVRRARALFAGAVQRDMGEAALTDALLGVLSDRALPAPAELEALLARRPTFGLNPWAREMQALWVRTPAYGTRSSTLCLLGGDAPPRYLYVEGAPERGPLGPPTRLEALLTAAPPEGREPE